MMIMRDAARLGWGTAWILNISVSKDRKRESRANACRKF